MSSTTCTQTGGKSSLILSKRMKRMTSPKSKRKLEPRIAPCCRCWPRAVVERTLVDEERIQKRVDEGDGQASWG